MSYHFHVLNNPSSIQSYSTHSGDDSLPADLCTDRKVLISFYIVISSLFIIYLTMSMSKSSLLNSNNLQNSRIG